MNYSMKLKIDKEEGDFVFSLQKVKYKNILDIKNLTIPSGKITCILGESGSGKTTLLKLLNKLVSYESGKIFYKKQLLEDIDSIELRRKVIMLSQMPAIFDGNIRHNLLMGLYFSQMPIVSDEKMYRVLEEVKLNKQLDEDAENLSGGEKQRLALARIMLLDPEVYLLDEPSSSLDEQTEDMIIRKLVEYTKKMDKTLIMVTHSKKIAENFADNIIEVKSGQIINKGELGNE